MELVRVTRTSETTARLVLGRASRRNAINTQMAQDIAEACNIITGWGVGVVALEAEGPAFCAGADLADLETAGKAVDAVVQTLLTAPLHFTAVVRGAVRGAGLALVASCPAVICSPDATFGMPEIAKGFFPGDLMDQQIACIGARPAFDLAFRGKPVDAERALALGLVSDVVAADLIDDVVEQRVTQLGSWNPDAVRDGVARWQAQVTH